MNNILPCLLKLRTKFLTIDFDRNMQRKKIIKWSTLTLSSHLGVCRGSGLYKPVVPQSKFCTHFLSLPRVLRASPNSSCMTGSSNNTLQEIIQLKIIHLPFRDLLSRPYVKLNPGLPRQRQHSTKIRLSSPAKWT